jgi:hypothetical protein
MASSGLPTTLVDEEDETPPTPVSKTIINGKPHETFEIEDPDSTALEDGLARRRIRYREPWWERLLNMTIRRRNQMVVNRVRQDSNEDEGLLQGGDAYEDDNDMGSNGIDAADNVSVFKTLQDALPVIW